MGPIVDTVEDTTAMPHAADVGIIGGGIIGVSAALFLARAGVGTVLCEKGQIAGEQSSRNWGWCRRMGRDPRELPLIVESMKLWEIMAELVDEDVGFRRSGILYLCETEDDVARRESWLRLAGDFALDSRMIEGAQLQSLLPGAGKSYRAALYTESDGRAEPQKAAPAIAKAALRAGAAVLTSCAVRGIETSGGRVSGIVTEKGRINCSSVIIAGGAWSSQICRPLSLRLPQLAVRASVLRTAPITGGPEVAVWAPRFAFRKRLDGGYTVANGRAIHHDIVPDSFRYFRDFLPVLGLEWPHVQPRLNTMFFQMRRGQKATAFENGRVLDPAPIEKHLKNARAELERVFPVFAGVPTMQTWAGWIDAMPDTVPVISEVKRVPGLFLATGFSGHGFGIGPGAGRLISDLVRGNAPAVDPSPFRYERFLDGTWPRPLMGI